MADTTTIIPERWTSRKFVAAMGWEAVFVALLWVGKLPVEAFITLTFLALGGYFMGNLAQSYIANMTGGQPK